MQAKGKECCAYTKIPRIVGHETPDDEINFGPATKGAVRNGIGSGQMFSMTSRRRRRLRFASRYGPWALVTGASSGIGLEMARRLAESGLNLVLVARNRQALESLGQELHQRHAVEVQIESRDLAQDAEIESLAKLDADIGLLICAAGFGTSGSFLRARMEEEKSMLAVNCLAPLVLSQAFGKRFAQRGKGGIVLFSSILAFQGAQWASSYAASKAYIQVLAEGLHRELASHGVSVLATAPGPVHTGFAARAGMRMSLALKPAQVAQATLDALGGGATVRPGWLSQLLEASLCLLPRSARVRIMSLVMSGMADGTV